MGSPPPKSDRPNNDGYIYWRILKAYQPPSMRVWWNILKTQPANTKLRLHWVARQPHGHVRRSQRPGVRLGTCECRQVHGILTENLSELEKIWSWIKATVGRVTVTPCYTYYNHHSSDITVRSVYFLPDKWLWRKVHQWFQWAQQIGKICLLTLGDISTNTVYSI